MNAPGSPSSPLQTTYFRSPHGFCHGAPLQAGRIAAAAAPAQPAFGDLVDHTVGRHFGERRQQRLVAVARDVVVDLFRIDVARILKHHVHLLVKMLIQIALQLRNRLAAQAGRRSLSACPAFTC